MNQNPYQAPGLYAPPATAVAVGAPSRTLFILAGVGAFLASGYWALMTLLLVAGMAAGTVSGTTLVFPVILIVLYALRGLQIIKGDVAAPRRIRGGGADGLGERHPHRDERHQDLRAPLRRHHGVARAPLGVASAGVSGEDCSTLSLTGFVRPCDGWGRPCCGES
jgi:hypothetical protein